MVHLPYIQYMNNKILDSVPLAYLIWDPAILKIALIIVLWSSLSFTGAGGDQLQITQL